MNYKNPRPAYVIVALFTSKNPTTDINGGFNNILLRKAFACNIKHENVHE
jgi:hypothetical protein